MVHKLNRVQGYLIIIDSNDNVIAHLPIDNYPVKEGVDLLPPIEDDVEQLAFKPAIEYKKMNQDVNTYDFRKGFESGYNKAREKYKYTEEDVKAFLETFTEHAPLDYMKSELEKGLHKRVGAQYPTEFESVDDYPVITDDDYFLKEENSTPKPKTTNNAQGRVWVGKYL